MGAVVEDIEEQVREKEAAKKREQQMERQFDQQALTYNRMGLLMEKEINESRKKMEIDVVQFREKNQQVQQRREFDLNDPDILKKSTPCRIGDSDPRLSISGGQIMHGEDLGFMERKKAQQEQMKTWVSEQSLERQTIREKELYEKRLQEQKEMETHQLAYELKMQEMEMRRRQEMMTKDFVVDQWKEKEERMRIQKEQEEKEKLQEIQNKLADEYLAECYHTTLSANNPSRFRPDHFKSLRPDQYEQIETTRQQQLMELKHKKEREQLEKAYWDKKVLLDQKMSQLQAREMERQRKFKNMEMADMYKRQAEEKKHFSPEF